MTKKLLSVFIVLFTVIVIHGNVKADDFTDAMLDAKANLQTALNKTDKSEALKVRGQFERILQLKQEEWLVNYYIALCDYIIAISEMSGGSELTDEAKKNLQSYTESGLETIDNVIRKKSDFSDAYVLKKFLNFNRWSYEQQKMNDIIDADLQIDAKAREYGENNPRYYLVNGIAAYWTPAAFGGGTGKAIDLLDKSDNLFNTTKPQNELYPEWGHDWAVGYKVLSLLKREDDGDMEKAKQLLDEGIKKFPDSGFLSYYVKGEYDKTNGSTNNSK